MAELVTAGRGRLPSATLTGWGDTTPTREKSGVTSLPVAPWRGDTSAGWGSSSPRRVAATPVSSFGCRCSTWSPSRSYSRLLPRDRGRRPLPAPHDDGGEASGLPPVLGRSSPVAAAAGEQGGGRCCRNSAVGLQEELGRRTRGSGNPPVGGNPQSSEAALSRPLLDRPRSRSVSGKRPGPPPGRRRGRRGRGRGAGRRRVGAGAHGAPQASHGGWARRRRSPGPAVPRSPRPERPEARSSGLAWLPMFVTLHGSHPQTRHNEFADPRCMRCVAPGSCCSTALCPWSVATSAETVEAARTDVRL